MFWSFALNIIQKFWKEILIVILIIILSFLWNRSVKLKQLAETKDSTITEITRGADEIQKQLHLTEAQFKTATEKLQWAYDSLEKKPKEIIKWQYIKTVDFIVDTTEVLVTRHDTIYKNSAELTKCGLSVNVKWNNEDVVWVVRDTTEFAIATYKNKSWYQFWKKKEYVTEVVNKCSEEIIANESYGKIKKR